MGTTSPQSNKALKVGKQLPFHQKMTTRDHIEESETDVVRSLRP